MVRYSTYDSTERLSAPQSLNERLKQLNDEISNYFKDECKRKPHAETSRILTANHDMMVGLFADTLRAPFENSPAKTLGDIRQRLKVGREKIRGNLTTALARPDPLREATAYDSTKISDDPVVKGLQIVYYGIADKLDISITAEVTSNRGSGRTKKGRA